MGKATAEGKKITLTGYVDPVDEDDQEAGIMITTDEGQEYLVEMNKQAKRLMNLLDQEVKVTGTVSKDAEGGVHISVVAFEVMEYEEDEEDFRDDE